MNYKLLLLYNKMSITILNETHSINLQNFTFKKKNISSLPLEICNLINLCYLFLEYNYLLDV
jgi:Leucine-rich repeat (LRR) protein